jgi:hypothetical protein
MVSCLFLNSPGVNLINKFIIKNVNSGLALCECTEIR